LLILFRWATSHHCLVNQQKSSSKAGPAGIIPYLVLIKEHSRDLGCWQVDVWNGDGGCRHCQGRMMYRRGGLIPKTKLTKEMLERSRIGTGVVEVLVRL